uniref:Reverse transcriptase domain-containing protein n=1 Tax=Parastrongyloides trichosuri TaxID=131310 RepID=A0A0N4ZTT9_PARTI
MVKRKRVVYNEESSPGENGVTPFTNTNETLPNEQSTSTGGHLAAEGTSEALPNKKGSVAKWSESARSRLETFLEFGKSRLRKISRQEASLVSWTLFPETELKQIAAAVTGKQITAKTFRETVNRFLLHERVCYVLALRDITPNQKKRTNVMERIENIMETDPSHPKNLLDQLKQLPIETQTHSVPKTQSPPKKKHRITSTNSHVTLRKRKSPITTADEDKLAVVHGSKVSTTLMEQPNPIHNDQQVNVSPRRGPRRKAARIDPQEAITAIIDETVIIEEVIPEEIIVLPTIEEIDEEEVAYQVISEDQLTVPLADEQNQSVGNSTTVEAKTTIEDDNELVSNEDVSQDYTQVRPRKKDKSKRNEAESNLTSQEKVQVRRKLRIGKPYGQDIPQVLTLKKANKLDGKTAQERFNYFYNLESMPMCKRWDNTKKVPIVEIDQVGLEKLQPLIEKLMDPECNQSTYETINTQWPKIANAMMLTAQSYVFKTNKKYKCTYSKTVEKRKQAKRQLDSMSRVWKARKNAKGKDKALLAKIRIKAKSHKISAKGYISRMQDVVAHLTKREKIEAQKAFDRKLRYMFDKSGSIKTVYRIQEGKTPKVPVKQSDAMKFYSELHAEKTSPDPLAIREWAEEWKNRPITHSLTYVKEFLTTKLKHSSPFKTPGPNKVYPAAFKRFKSIAKLLEAKVIGLLSGKFCLTSDEMIAKAFLLPKTSEPSTDPSEYRAINCINSDIKYVNAVTYEFIYQNCFRYLAINQAAAFKGLPGTLHAMMVNNAILKQNPKSKSVLYVDMKKAFDSVSHKAIKLAISVLNLPDSIKSYINDMLSKGGFTISNIESSKSSKPGKIEVHQGVMQGCALAPCLFVIAMDVISFQLNKQAKVTIGKTTKDFIIYKGHQNPISTEQKVNKKSFQTTGKGQGNIVTKTIEPIHIDRRAQNQLINHISFVDDVKIYAKDNNSLRTMKNIFESVALQLGLHVNAKKCGAIYNKVKDDNIRLEDIVELDSCYKYLGIPELGRSVGTKQLELALEKKILASVCKVFSTKLNIGQKIRWYNSTIAPAVAYVVTHALPAVRKGSLTAICKRLDNLVVKILAGGISGFENIEVRQQTTSRPRLFCSHLKGGLGLASLKTVAYEAIVRHMMSLWMDPANSQVKGLYIDMELKKSSKSTPISQFMSLMDMFNINVELTESGINLNGEYRDTVNQATKEIAKIIREISDEKMYQAWIQNMDYSKTYDSMKLEMPWLKRAAVSDLQANLIMSSQQQSLPGINWHINKRNGLSHKPCPLCQQELTTSHVISGCKDKSASLKYTTRHDAVLASVTNSILKHLGVGFKSLTELRKLRENETLGKDWSISFDAPQRVIGSHWRDDDVTNAIEEDRCRTQTIVHNRPDLVLLNHKLKKVILLEVAIVGNPQLIPRQIEIKRVRYMKNSQVQVGPENYLTVANGKNMRNNFKEKYGEEYEVLFVPFVVGAYGEILPGFIKDFMDPLLSVMSEQHIQAMVACASRTAAVNTVFVIRFWLSLIGN